MSFRLLGSICAMGINTEKSITGARGEGICDY